MKFDGAVFTDQIPYTDFARNPDVAGFRKYSVASCSDIGAEPSFRRKFIRNSAGVVVEDVSFNIAESIAAFGRKVNSKVTGNDYDGEKNANRASILYTDDKGSGKIDLFTNSRSCRSVEGGGFYYDEQLRQSSVRRSNDPSRRPSQVSERASTRV